MRTMQGPGLHLAQFSGDVPPFNSLQAMAIGGEYSAADAPRTMLEPVSADLRGAIIPSCGHLVPEEAPDALLHQLVPFLRGER